MCFQTVDIHKEMLFAITIYLPMCIYMYTCAFRQNQLYHLRPLVIFSNLPLFFLGVFISSPEALFSLTAQFKSAMYEPSWKEPEKMSRDSHTKGAWGGLKSEKKKGKIILWQRGLWDLMLLWFVIVLHALLLLVVYSFFLFFFWQRVSVSISVLSSLDQQ